ncbi:hypothetical protein BDZ45DRAFT_752006 [Acephala macrosclerotiorum]|nr:hypothetical protein BDZ45DRAFT_752006 [Acephala macrosclerotiorum]
MEGAALYALWDIVHLKYDSCCSHIYASKADVQKVLLDVSLALLSQTHPIIYHAWHCVWQGIWEWTASIGANHWRIGQGISDDFNDDSLREGYYNDNDYDMLMVSLNHDSNQLAMVASPLLIGADVRKIDNYFLKTPTNMETVALNQDQLDS